MLLFGYFEQDNYKSEFLVKELGWNLGILSPFTEIT